MVLLIAEELLVLAYREDGRPGAQRVELNAALAGALLVELALAGSVELDGNRVRAVEGGPVPGRPVLVDALAETVAKVRRPKAWVQRLARKVRPRLLADLVAAGVLTEQPHRVLGVLSTRRYPPADPDVRVGIERRLRAAVIDGGAPDQRTAALAGLLHAAKLGRRVFPGDDRARVKRRLAEIAEGDWAADAVRGAIRAAHAATAAAASAAATSAASSGS